MSNSYKSKNGTIFHYNNDFSGNIKIIHENKLGVYLNEKNEELYCTEILGDDILEFVACCCPQTKNSRWGFSCIRMPNQKE